MKTRLSSVLVALMILMSVIAVPADASAAFDTGFEVSEYYYTQLDKYSASVYSDLKNNLLAGKMNFVLSWPDSLEYTVTVPDGMSFNDYLSSPDSILVKLNDRISLSLQTAAEALSMDHPEIFWVDISSSRVSSSIAGSGISGTYTVTVTPEFQGNYRQGYSQSEVVSTFNAMIRLMHISADQSSRYSTLKAIHDFICKTVTYGGSSLGHENNAANAITNGVSKCEGYGKLFKLFCDMYSIPCVCVVGTSINTRGRTEEHLWNYVQMEDGKWYGVDVTWDDQSKIYYDFFLVGSDTEAANFDRKAFSQSHIESGYITPGYSNFLFTYPELSTDAYFSGTQTEIPTETPTEPISEPITEPVTEPITEPVTEPITEPVTEPVTESVTEPITEPVTEPVTEPITEPVTEPITEPVTEPITEPVTEPITEPITEPVTEPKTEPITEPQSIPTEPNAQSPTEQPTEKISEPPTEPTTEYSEKGTIPAQAETDNPTESVLPTSDQTAVAEPKSFGTILIPAVCVGLIVVIIVIVACRKKK